MDYDVLVLGGGIIGCAVAYELSKYNLNIAVIEKEYDIADDVSFVNTSIVYDGSETSNNVMAGLEYIGNILLEDLCEKFNVPFKRIGSLRVVNDDNGVVKLGEMYERAIRRGIDGVYLVEPDEVYEIEPNINTSIKKGLYSQNVAIVAPYDLAIAYAEVASDNGVNFRLEEEVLNIENKVEDVTQALMTMAKGSTRTKEVNELTKQIIAEAVSQEYAARGITANPASLYESSSSSNVFERRRKEMPTIGSWYKRIKQSAQSNTNKDYEFHYSYLLKVMKQYIREYNGQMAYFDGQSTFDLMEGAPLINIDISQLEERFARPLAQQILMSWIWEKFVKKNSEDKRKARQKRVIVDEAWMLLPFPEAVDFLNKMARRARKRNVSLAIISQRFQDFYEKPEAQAVLTSSDTKLFLAQDKSEIQQLKEVFKLSEGEASFLVTCSKGEGLLKVGQDTAVIQITPTRKEFEFVETNMNKLVANNQRDDQRNINKN